jgi:hypothetical protein
VRDRKREHPSCGRVAPRWQVDFGLDALGKRRRLFFETEAKAGERPAYAVITVNSVGLKSEPATAEPQRNTAPQKPTAPVVPRASAYYIDGAISREVLENYLSRAISVEGVFNDRADLDDRRHLLPRPAALDLQPHRSRYWLNAKPDPQKEEKIRVVCARYQQAQESRARFLSDPTHRIRFCYTPKHASWMNQIDIWFGLLGRSPTKTGGLCGLLQPHHGQALQMDLSGQASPGHCL